MNWFERHLNWTWFFGYTAVVIIANTLVILIAGLLPPGIGLILAWFLNFGCNIPLGLWVLKEKGQNQSYVFSLILPLIGFFILLGRENIRAEKEKIEEEERLRYTASSHS